MYLFYYDSKSILVINPKGQVRRLFTPFRVYGLSEIANPEEDAIGGWVYVDEVHMDKIHRLLFLINGKLYPYHLFQIRINF
jgi:hypothetical protein